MTIKRTFLVLLALSLSFATGSSRLQPNQFNGFNGAERDPDMVNWLYRIRFNGGAVPDNQSVQVARNFLNAFHQKSYRSKIIVIYAWLGADINGLRTPLYYSGTNPAATALTQIGAGFTYADYSFSTGLQGNGSSKALRTNILASELGTSNNGGLGWVENNINVGGSTTVVMGATATSSNWYMIGVNASLSFACWGDLTNNYNSGAVLGGNGRYYMQRSSPTSRELFKNGSSVGTSTVSDAAPMASLNDSMFLFGWDYVGTTPQYWAGRSACAYMTDGTMSGADVADFDTFLQTYLLTPTGR